MEDPQERQRLAANRRRQQYFARRRIVQRLDREGLRLETERMTVQQLTSSLETHLAELVRFSRDGSNPEQMASALAAWECFCGLIDRGEQLSLL